MNAFLRSLPVALGALVGLTLGWWILPGVVFEDANPAVPFSHAVHTGDDVGLECDDCHRVRDVRAVSLPTAAQCIDCHDEIPGSDFDLESALARDDLWGSSLRQPEGVHFSHAQHVDLAALACTACHGDHGQAATATVVARNRISGYPRALWGRDGVGPMNDHGAMEMSDCVRCHDQRAVVQSCLDCHR